MQTSRADVQQDLARLPGLPRQSPATTTKAEDVEDVTVWLP